VYRSESSCERPGTDPFGRRPSGEEPVFFIVLKNEPEPIPVGFIQLDPIHSPTHAVKTTQVKELFVVPDYRNNGIALKLIEAGVKFAIENKSAFIQLKPVRDNLIAQRLFESVGFKSQPALSENKVYSIQFS
jgi:ribosomal protein S18 acetylase RimI-like enzyme